MSKQITILCIAVFVSAANAGFVTDQLEKTVQKLDNFIESTITEVKLAVADAKRKTEELSTQLKAQANEYEKKISDDVESKVQKAVDNINDLTNSIRGVDVTECSKLVDHLQATAHVTILQMKKCFVDKHIAAVGYVENMMKVADEVLASLHIHRLDVRACVDNVDGFVSASKALVCANMVAAKAGLTAAKAAPALSVEGAKLTLLLTTLPSSLTVCTATSALNTFYNEMAGITGKTAKCVQQSIEEVHNKKTTVPKIEPENTVSTESISTAESASTAKPERTSTPAFDEKLTTAKVQDVDF